MLFKNVTLLELPRPCTKHNYLVKDINKLSTVFHEAFAIAKNGRPGPVLIDIPKDVQFATGSYLGPKEISINSHRLFESYGIKGNDTQIEEASKLIANAKKPIFYIGGGCINSGPKASKFVREFVKLTGAPASMTLMGLGTYYHASDPLSLGMLGNAWNV